MMKKITLLFSLVLMCLSAVSQAPEKFNYQGVARDLSGDPLSDREIGLKISILESSSAGPSLFVESHDITTNSLGLFNIQLGNGNRLQGEFSSINWGDESHFVQVEMDANGGTNYEMIGVSELLSVPYALHSANGSKWQEIDGDLSYSKGAVAIGQDSPNPSALLELHSNNQGFLLPRISLIESTNFRPLESHVEGMMVYNTSLINDVSPGCYINDGTKWIGMAESLDKIEDLQETIDDLKSQIPIKRAVIIAGQSNTTWGGGSAAIPDFSGKNLSQLGRANMNLQVIPLTFYGTQQNSINVNGGSFGSIFLYHYYEDLKKQFPDRDVQLLLIPCGAGGSGWASSQYPNNSWRTDAAYFSDIVSRIKWAKNNGYQIDAFLWHQGETDAIAQTVNYKDIIKNFISSMRDFVGDPELPFVLGEMVQSWASPLYDDYQAIINEIPEEVPFTKTASSEGLTLADAIHFDARAHVELGQRYFDQFLLAKDNASPPNYITPRGGQHLIYNFNSTSGQVFPDIFSAIHFGDDPNEERYSRLGDIWKYRNEDGYYRFSLEVVSGSGISGGIFEWKQKINPFGLSETGFEDRSGSIVLNNTIGLDTDSGQGFSSLVYDVPANTTTFTTLFHADVRSATNFWWFSVGQVTNFANQIPIVEGNNSISHVRLSCIKE